MGGPATTSSPHSDGRSSGSWIGARGTRTSVATVGRSMSVQRRPAVRPRRRHRGEGRAFRRGTARVRQALRDLGEPAEADDHPMPLSFPLRRFFADTKTAPRST